MLLEVINMSLSRVSSMYKDTVKVIGEKSSYVEITVDDDFQVIETDEVQKMIDENLGIISELKEKQILNH